MNSIIPAAYAKGAIVATIGPASNTPEKLEDMIAKGLDVVRLNLSHGTHEDHKKQFEVIRQVNDAIPILFDISGPKIRIGNLPEPIRLDIGDTFTLSKNEPEDEEYKASLSYKGLVDEAEVGQVLYLNDGLLEFEIIDKTKDDLICKVNSTGVLSSRKGVNTPNIPIKLYAPTEKDLKDIEFTMDLEPDYYSLSFVRRTEDLDRVRDLMRSKQKEITPIISKIEHQDALKEIDPIMKWSNGIMVARGDLGVEIPPQEIPLVQRELIKKSNYHGIPCIVATQMLESMVTSIRPTRAEVSDVYSAIIQGSDAVMLSAETATGKYPVESIDMMNKIIISAQNAVKHRPSNTANEKTSIPEAIGRSAVSLAAGREVKTIITFTRSGTTSAMVSKFKPKQRIVGITPYKRTARRMRLQWGVIPLIMPRDFTDTDHMISEGIMRAYECDILCTEEEVVIVAGSLLGLPYDTNLIKIVDVMDIVSSQEAINRFARAYTID